MYAPRPKKSPVIAVGNFPALGQLAAMRFLEWVQDQSRRSDLLAHRQDAGAFHPLGRPPAGDLGRAATTQACWKQAGDRSRPQARHAKAAFRADRRVLSDPAGPAQQLLLLREQVLCRRDSDWTGQGPVDGLHGDRPGRRADARFGLARWPRRFEPPHPAGGTANWKRRSRPCCGASTSGARNTKSGFAPWAASASFWAASVRTGTSASTFAAPTIISTTRLMATNYETQAAAAGDLGGHRSRARPAGDHHRAGNHHRESGNARRSSWRRARPRRAWWPTPCKAPQAC